MLRRHRPIYDSDDDTNSESCDPHPIVVLGGGSRVSKHNDDDDYDKNGKKEDRYENWCRRLIFLQVLILVAVKLLSMINSAGGKAAAFAALKTKVLPTPTTPAGAITTASPITTAPTTEAAAATTTNTDSTNDAATTTAETVEPEVRLPIPSFSDIKNYDLVQNDDAVKDGNHKSYLLRYESSQWEKDWIEFMENLESQNKMTDDYQLKNAICQKLGADSFTVRRYLHATCNSFYGDSNWCKIGDFDGYRTMYFNRQTGSVVEDRPPDAPDFTEPTQPVVITAKDTDIFSRFVYKHPDGSLSYQYIEPLVGYLRHPLFCCETTYKFGAKFKKQANPANGKCWGSLRTSRAHLVYPAAESLSKLNATSSSSPISKLLYFDVLDSKSWSTNVLYLFDAYKLNTGFQFHNVHVVGHESNQQTLMNTVPEQYRSIVKYSSIPSDHQETNQIVKSTFDIISRLSTAKDYTVVKLVSHVDPAAEVSPTLVETEIDFLLTFEKNQHFLNPLIDEMYIEFHSQQIFSPGRSLAYWYKIFFLLRKKYGIRSHSWQQEKA